MITHQAYSDPQHTQGSFAWWSPAFSDLKGKLGMRETELNRAQEMPGGFGSADERQQVDTSPRRAYRHRPSGGIITPEGRTRGPGTHLAVIVNGVAITALGGIRCWSKHRVLWSLDDAANLHH